MKLHITQRIAVAEADFRSRQAEDPSRIFLFVGSDEWEALRATIREYGGYDIGPFALKWVNTVPEYQGMPLFTVSARSFLAVGKKEPS